MLPDIILGFNNQTFNGTMGYRSNQRFNSFEIGIAIPIFPNSGVSKIKVAKTNEQITRYQVNQVKSQIESEATALYLTYTKLRNTLIYYQDEALPEAKLIVENSKQGFASGDISYTQYLQNISMSNDIQLAYLEYLLEYNKVIASLEAVYNK